MAPSSEIHTRSLALAAFAHWAQAHITGDEKVRGTPKVVQVES